jgi:PTH2 family peptidyl-tRNA hydrolase
MEPKQVIVVRKDLNMRKGKLAAQCCHASMKIILDRLTIHANHKRILELSAYTPYLQWWIDGLFTKIVVGCDSLEEILELQQKANDMGIINAIIQDSGKTEFHGEPTYTALAIGPDDPQQIDKITGHLKLL